LRGDKYINDTDLWSLGLTLMECALGKFPLEFNKKAKLWDLIGMHDKPIPKLPSEFSAEFSDFLDIW
jgi:serine/threonine protein kinase